MKANSPSMTGLVLSAGGARAAYQVGVLHYIAQNIAHFNPVIFAGTSAGSINATFLAQGDPLKESTERLAAVWSGLTFDQVIEANFSSLFGVGRRWMYDLFVSKVTKRLLLKSLLDASPLAQTLLNQIHFWKVSRSIREGRVQGLALSATNYYDGNTNIFYDSHKEIAPWRREQRQSFRTLIRVKHIMASCSIPFLFEPVRVGKFLYGDGSLRFSFPFSPAIKLGANRLLAIGIRCPTPENPFPEGRPDSLSMGYIAGAVLNSIFLDSLEFDFENLMRINQIAGPASAKQVSAYMIRPSQDLGAMAKDYLHEIPFHLRQLLRATASPAELGDLLSYLMFSKGYVGALIDLGKKDAARQKDKLEAFFAPQ